MKSFKVALLSAAASIALAGAAFAQTVFPQIVQLSDGTIAVLAPVMTVPQPQFGTVSAGDPRAVAAVTSPFAMIRQIDAMMDDARRAMASGESIAGDRSVASVVVTSFSDGRNTCTRRVTYAGDGSAPKVEVRSTGGGCAGGGIPAASPDITPAPARSMPRTLEVENRGHTVPLQVASAR